MWNENPKLVTRFIRVVPGRRDEIAIEPEFVTALLRHNYTTTVRKLDRLFAQSFIVSEGNTLQPPPELLAEIAATKATETWVLAQAALDQHKGHQQGLGRY